MNAKLNQKQLVDLLCSNAGLKKREAEAFIDAFFGVVEEQLLKGEQVKIKGLGVFKTIIVDERESVNVNTGERIKIESYTKISFTPDSDLKELINKPFAAFEPMVISDFQAAMIESSVDSEVVIETETEEQLSGTEDVVELAEETIS
ncbi:MAG: HU family DNA-binding protein [Bacteroidaceae bacterium]|nr:HU family DNA-binding protein [Bacteroidaceae bacterium]